MINLTSHDEGSQTPEDAQFSVGQIVCHRRYGYRGVIVAFDPVFSGSDAWYQKNHTQPPKNQPWYHVLVDGSASTTYAAQTSLESDVSGAPVSHPLVDMFFGSFDDGRYIRNEVPWDVS